MLRGLTLTNPLFEDGDTLKTFNFVVANPPFSDKRWRTGLDPIHDRYERFKHFGVPPGKQGDYAYLLHIVRSLKSTPRPQMPKRVSRVVSTGSFLTSGSTAHSTQAR